MDKCPVCSHPKFPHQQYCNPCAEWKEQAENARATEARIKAFGSIFPISKGGQS